jgi:hypothetical protein
MAAARAIADQLHEGIDRAAAGRERFASDSVDGQRSRPSGVMRLDLLKVVGSRPERRASPEGESPARSASRSSAAQTWPWVGIRGIFGYLAMRNSRPGLGIISRITVLRRGLPGGA